MLPPHLRPWSLRPVLTLLTFTLLGNVSLAHDLTHEGFSRTVQEWTVASGAGSTLNAGPFQIEVPAKSFSSKMKIELLQGKAADWQDRSPNGTRVLEAFALVVTDLKTGKHLTRVPGVTVRFQDDRVNNQVQVWTTGPGTSSPVAAQTTTGRVSFPVTDLSNGWFLALPDSESFLTVNMQNMQFRPSHLTVKAGQQVRFVQQDTLPHNVVIDGVMQSPPAMKKGEVFTFTFKTKGNFQVFCEIHPTMTLAVTVQ